MSTTPAGWYDDGQGALRWWDGSQWTEHTHPLPGAEAPAAGDAAPTTPVEPQDAAAVAPAEPAPEEPAEVADPGIPAADPLDASPPEAPGPDAPGAPALPSVADAGEPGPEAAAYGVPEAHAAAAAYPGSAAAAYPGAGGIDPATGELPPHPAPAGLPVPPRSRTARGWVLPVAIGGGLVVLLIVLGIVLVPMLVGLVSTAVSGATSPDSGTSEPALTDEQEEVVDAVRGYDDAWDEGDCDLLVSVTTQDFRVTQGIDDCAVFEENAAYFGETTDDYELNVTDVTQDSDERVTVETNETFTTFVDEEGNTLEEGSPAYADFVYTVVLQDGTWLIDEMTYVE